MASVMLPTFDERVIAVIGVAKNCGKTTTLNALTAAARGSRALGLASIGIDGETRDALLGTPKPPVRVAAGDLVATTRQLLSHARFEVELVHALDFTTPLGDAVIARARGDGDVMIGGLRHRADVADAVKAMQQHGAQQVWIDGAYARVSAADPTLSDGVVVATGAVLSDDLGELVAETVALVRRVTAAEVSLPWQRDLLDAALQRGRTLFGGPNAPPREATARSGLLAAKEASRMWGDGVEALAVPGLVSDTMLRQLLRAAPRGTLLVRDGTSVQADRRLLERFEKSWTLLVGQSNRLLAVAFNPTSPGGAKVRAEDLRARLEAALPNTTVFDPIVGLH